MSRFGVYITDSQDYYIEVNAKNAQEAEELAFENMDDAAPTGDSYQEVEVEEL